MAILSAGMQEVFEMFSIFPGPQNIFSLSWWGLHQWYLWQPLTFLFVQNSSDGGLSFYFVMILFFDMYLLWVLGSALMDMIGKRSFLNMYFLGTIAAGTVSLLSMLVTGRYDMIAGIAPATLIVVTVWTMAFPETEILLFFLIPFKAKRIVIAVVGSMIFMALIYGKFSLFILYVAAVAFGYGYSSFCWGLRGPYPFMKRFDEWLIKVGFAGRQKSPVASSDKIVDITSGQPPQNDDAFVDAMLAKISRHGESSLSWSEKRRLQKISEQKMQDRRQ